MAEEQHRLYQFQLDKDWPARAVPQHVGPGIERLVKAGGRCVVCAAGQVQHVRWRLARRHVLGLAFSRRLAEPQQRLLAHAVRQLAIDEDHRGLGLRVDQVTVGLEHHGPPGRVQFLHVPAGRVVS
jgi:hypothetical protein